MSRVGLSEEDEASLPGIVIRLNTGNVYVLPDMTMQDLAMWIDGDRKCFRSRDYAGVLRLIATGSIAEAEVMIQPTR